jgi:1-aminocyclopropane-1-carboxylate deaminase
MTLPSQLQAIKHPLFSQHNLSVMIKRDDLIHPIISGNKWRKLKYNIEAVKKSTHQGIISFGGAYSNHIHALAYACHLQDIKAIGIIRGESHYADNFTLKWTQHWGMKLHFVDRKTYRLRHNADYLNQLADQYPDYFIVPEGGSNKLALQGVAEVIKELDQQTTYDTLITPVGSGGTLAGLVAADNKQHNILGIAVLKQSEYLLTEIKKLLPPVAKHFNNWQLLEEFHRGGYAKFSQQDCQRIIEFSAITGIRFEPVYSGKMILALLDLIEQGYFKANERIVLLHTGGLQGLGGMAERGIISASQWPVPKSVLEITG